jgi:ABC-type uncharacterized transport system permease subunit
MSPSGAMVVNKGRNNNNNKIIFTLYEIMLRIMNKTNLGIHVR